LSEQHQPGEKVADNIHGVSNGPGESDGRKEIDLTGKDRLVGNVIYSWLAHFVLIVSGFIMPRVIDHQLGQDLLGVWDFAWSLVSYFGLVQAGVGSSVNRYVARYRAASDIAGINRIVSSATFILVLAGLLVLVLTIAVSLLLPSLFGDRLGDNLSDAQWVVFFLGISLVAQIAITAFNGVLTGCHKWGIHNFIKSGGHLAIVIGMIIILLRGGGLPGLALMCFAGYFLADITKVIFAYRVCEGLKLRFSMVGWKTIKSVFAFGGKTLIPSVSNMLLNQTSSILIIAYLGPAALALYTRPRSLIRHMNTLVNKMAMTLVPTTSAMQSTGDMKGIGELLVKSVRYSLYIVLPMVLVLVVFGSSILKLWMGPSYANGLLPAILAAGFTAAMANLPLISILAGMNAHGRAGLAQLVASIVTVGLAILFLGPLDLGLTGLAVAVTLPLTIMNLVYLPFYICRQLDLNLWKYYTSTIIKPVVYVLPFAFCLMVSKLFFSNRPLIGLICGGLVGGMILSVLYWRYVLPQRIKTRFFCFKIATTQK